MRVSNDQKKAVRHPRGHPDGLVDSRKTYGFLVAVGAVLAAGSMVATYDGWPFFICTMTAGFLALRFSSMVMTPVTPEKFSVSAMAFARLLPSQVGARSM